MNEAYFDPTFGGADWSAVREKYHSRLGTVTDKTQLRVLLQQMLGELHRTHFAILPREAAVFNPAERSRIGTVGVDVTCVDEEVVVERVLASSPAEAAGLKPGDSILSINGHDLAQLRTFLDKAGLTPARRQFYLRFTVSSGLRPSVGSKIEVVAQSAGEAPRKLMLESATYAGDWSEPIGDQPSVPIELEARQEANGLAILRFNIFSPRLMKKIRSFLLTLQPAGGLVIDLRGNVGGTTLMAPGISGWLSSQEYYLGAMTLRQGFMPFAVFPQEHAFAGPVAVLIDAGSASTSEIMAAGLQEAKRVRVFGETSAGAALPSMIRGLPTHDLFQYAIADMKTPAGKLIEGVGVIPDDVVRRSRDDLAQGLDPVMESARNWIEHERVTRAKPVDASTQ